MAIKINGTSVIDDDKNISNVGIITVGTGGTTGTLQVGTGVTIDGAGNAYFDGYITVNGGINYLVGLTSIYPQDTDLADSGQFVTWNGNLDLYFDSPVEVVSAGIGTTLTVQLRKNSISGTITKTAGISSINYLGGDFSVLRVAFGGISTAPGSGVGTYYPIIPKGIIQFSAIGQDYVGNFSGDSEQDQFTFEFSGRNLGDALYGGYLICSSGGTSWIVAPSSTEVIRNWYLRTDSVTTANASAACGDWFVPERSQYQNPGYVCKVYWDSVSPTNYWSNTESSARFAYSVNMGNGSSPQLIKHIHSLRVRAFRCVIY